MITINLLAQALPKRTPVAVPVGRLAALFAMAVGIAAIAVAGFYGVRWWANRPHAPPAPVVTAPQTAPAVPERKPPAETAPVVQEVQAPVTTAQGYQPSTHVKSQVVEEVVNDIDASGRRKAVDLTDLAYGEMSLGEQINYEFVFVKNVLQIFTRAVPAGIGFTMLGIDSFQTVSGAGLAPSRENVIGLFENLRREKIEMRDPPGSSIRQAGNQGYRFSFTGAIRFGVNQADPWRLTDHLEPRETVRSAVDALSRRLAAAGLRCAVRPSHLSTNKIGTFRRSSYRFSGSGPYLAFVRFVLDLNDARVPCAFSSIRIKARSSGGIDFSADAVFTTRE